ncbi:MAG: cyclic nucleotide-binding domain-containing protein [Betaproteobacteria bacterium]|nr:cyclic nucleotide-binding domain-containing protein [Betaproteobacteria bacterium]
MNSGNLGKTYANGEIIVRQGDSGDCMFAIQKGRIEVIRRGKGGEVRVATLEEGEIFGEMAIFEREARSATVRALGETRVLTVDKKTFLRRVQEDPSLAFNLVRMMSQRIRRLSGEIAELQPGSVPRSQDTLALTEAERRIERRNRPERRVIYDRRTGENRRKREERRSGDAAPATAA